MLEKIKTSAEAEARSWIADFSRSLAGGDVAAISALFVPDSHWRNLCGISWEIATFSGADKLADELGQRGRAVRACGFDVDTELLTPRRAPREGCIAFSREVGTGWRKENASKQIA